MVNTQKTVLLVVLAALATVSSGMQAAEVPSDDAWKALPKYEPGQDMAALLTIDREVIAAMKTPESRAACAARLADLLDKNDTTLAAKQYICLQLRQVGTAAQVPLLSQLLAKPETAEMARYALESIPGAEATAALRDALGKTQGEHLLGVVGSVAKRNDSAAVAVLKTLADSEDPQVATAAIRALGSLADGIARQFLFDRAEKAGVPTPQVLAVALLRHAAAGQQAEEIYTKLSQAGQPAATRRAALEGLLRLQGAKAEPTVLQWFSCDDADRRRIAAGHLQKLSDEQLDQLLAQLADLPDASKLAVIELAAARRGADVLPLVMSLVESPKVELKQAGIRYLGLIGDTSAIPKLIDTLAAGSEVTAAAQAALASLPRPEVTKALLEALQNRPAARVPVIAVLVDLKCYDAIDPLVEIAADTDAAVYGPALEGLRGIADPDKTDIPRLVKLLLRSEAGKHRDEAEKTILLVCDKLPAGADRSELVLAALAKVDRAESPKYLPVLGRLGGAKALAAIDQSLADSDPAVQEAAVRALCNWPNAEVAERLLKLATDSKDRAHRLWALRAYIRVVSLKSDRPEAETLAMLQNAFQLADGVSEKRLAIERASTVRTMEAVNWVAPLLDDPQLAQAACGTLVELAHHRFLRHPNMGHFGPILDKVAKISEDPAIVERAKRYRLGL